MCKNGFRTVSLLVRLSMKIRELFGRMAIAIISDLKVGTYYND